MTNDKYTLFYHSYLCLKLYNLMLDGTKVCLCRSVRCTCTLSLLPDLKNTKYWFRGCLLSFRTFSIILILAIWYSSSRLIVTTPILFAFLIILVSLFLSSLFAEPNYEIMLYDSTDSTIDL